MISFFIGSDNYACKKLLAISDIKRESGFIELLTNVADCDDGSLSNVYICMLSILCQDIDQI